MWKQDNRFLPNHTALLVAHVVDLIEYDLGDFTDDLGAKVEH